MAITRLILRRIPPSLTIRTAKSWAIPEGITGMNYRNYIDEPTAKKTYEVFNGVYRTGQAIKVYDYQIIERVGLQKLARFPYPP